MVSRCEYTDLIEADGDPNDEVWERCDHAATWMLYPPDLSYVSIACDCHADCVARSHPDDMCGFPLPEVGA